MPTMFLPLVGNSAHFELRASGDPTALVKQVRAVVAQADNNLPLFDVRTQSQQIEQALYQERLMSRLSSFFACLALILACIGLYGLLSYEVARRTRELGIRMALGAQRRELMRLVVQRGLLLALAGAVIGTGAAMAVTRLMSAMLYNVRPYDPATFAEGCILLVLVALVACRYPPGGRCASTPWSRCATSDARCQSHCSSTDRSRILIQNRVRHREASGLTDGEQKRGALQSFGIECGGNQDIRIVNQPERKHQRFFFCARYALIS